ncbi:MAG: aspartate/glutamate racemase family protein [Beijerinckiaceae bacterium]|nr:aspartate/glutamate racemase family protein [Beijerinckiaceae bacterium]
MPRLLVINPNTTQAITDKVADAIRALAPADVEIKTRTGAFGPRYIASRATFAIAGHAALDAFARDRSGAEAVLLACFGDPGLDALREVSTAPVIGLVEAAVAEASKDERRYSIVTGGLLWRDMLMETLKTRGLDPYLASVLTVAPTGGQIAADPEGALITLVQACARALADDGADAVILGGAGLVGLAAKIQARVGAPVICSVEAGAKAAFAAIRAGAANALHTKDAPRIDSVGVSDDLSELLAGRSSAHDGDS